MQSFLQGERYYISLFSCNPVIQCYSLKHSELLTGLVREITILGHSVPITWQFYYTVVTVTFKHLRKDWCTLYCMSQSYSLKIWVPFHISSSPFSFNWAINISETISAWRVLHFWLQVVLCISEWNVSFTKTFLKTCLLMDLHVWICELFSHFVTA